MRKITISIFFLFSLISCEKKENINEFPVTLRYELLNKQGNRSTQFYNGENIIFSFKMTNNTDSILYYETNFMNDEFFKVYKKSGGELDAIGKPYHSINYEYRLGQNFIPARQTYGFILPWIADSSVNHYPQFFWVLPNRPLNKGEYYTSFSSKFKFYTKKQEIVYESKNKSFEINFNIK